MQSAIGRTAFLNAHIQRGRHRHADVALAGQMRERRCDARTQMGKRHSRAYRDAQLRHALMQQIQDRCGLRDMAVAVAGDGDDEVSAGHFVWCI